MVDKRSAQVVSVSPQMVQLMDLETYEMFEVSTFEDQEILNKLESGKEVEYWHIMDRYKIQRIKN
jgi:translation initiation factor 5A